MNADTLELAPIEGEPARTEVATAAAAAIDITAVNLTDLALAKFGPWREDTKKAKAEFTALVLDLKTQSAIDEAVSLRNRKIKQPLADARKTAQALKSKLSAVSKAVGDELPLIEAAWADAAGAITPRIEAAQKVLDDAKAEAARIEAERKAGHEAFIATIRAYLTHCQQPGMTSARIEAGMKALQAVTIGPEREEYAVPAANAQCETLEAMRVLHAQTLGREQEAERQARIAEENRLQAEANAREAARIAAEAEELRRRAAELQRLEAEAAARERAAAEAEQRAREQEAARIAAQQAEDARVAEEARQREAAAATPAPATVEVPYVATLKFDHETRIVEGVMSTDVPSEPAATVEPAEPAAVVPAGGAVFHAGVVEAVRTQAARLDEPATLTLGEICNRLDPDGGCRLTAAFLADRLHITPAKTAPNGGKLFTETQFQQLCDQAARHFSAMAELYAPETV